jgi:glycosyltransferase involved in cell wall biosynthesis
MRILMLAQFYSPIIGGEERHVQDLSTELVKRGHSVAVATLHTSGAAEYELSDGIRIYRIKGTMGRTHRFYSQTERNHAPPFPDPEVVLALHKIIAREQPQIIHAHNWILHSFLPLKIRHRIPLVLSLHDYSGICVQKRLMYKGVPCSGPGLTKCLSCASDYYGGLKGKAATLSHRITTSVSRAAVDFFLPVSMATAIGNDLLKHRLPFEIIPNFLPDVGSAPENVDTYVSQLPGDGYLLFVGDLSPDKGVGVLLPAYAALENPPPLVLIGRSSKSTPTELPENVIMLKSWPHAAVMEAWRRCSIALAPSVWSEPFGIVAIEALSMGKPVIASRIGGLTDIVVDGESGFLIPPGNPAALTQAMKRLVEDKSLRERMSQGALRRSQDFRASVVVPRIETVYRKLTDRAAGMLGINEHQYELLS